ncbi:MAG: chemotaxis protein CheW [Porticoccaceae bacterium]|nr:chemotaxis protein CheW [Porticoccaceae bacterium]
MSKVKKLFSAISGVAGRFSETVYGLPAQKQIVEARKLIAFNVLGYDYLIPLDEVSEILELPESIKLPRVKSWITGLANVRGRLLPIVDLAAFLGGSLCSTVRDRRVLVLDINSVYVGVIVDSVQGIKSLPVDQHQSVSSQCPMARFTDGIFIEEKQSLSLFCARKLIEDDQFMTVAI